MAIDFKVNRTKYFKCLLDSLQKLEVKILKHRFKNNIKTQMKNPDPKKIVFNKPNQCFC